MQLQRFAFSWRPLSMLSLISSRQWTHVAAGAFHLQSAWHHQQHHKTDLIATVLSVQPDKDPRCAELERSLRKLKTKDLMALLTTTGQQLSGTKPVLVNRLTSYLSSIAHQIERQSQRSSVHGEVELDLKRPQQDNFESIPQRCFLEQIKHRILPQSVVSIDIGIRNLAWVELSKEGEILRWSVEDLLSTLEDNPQREIETRDLPPGPCGASLMTEPSLDDSNLSDSLTESKSAANLKKVSKKSPKIKASSVPFDHRAVALRLDKIMRKIMCSDSVQVVLVERQRFRTAGMHAILDATFKCGVVEGMIHAWLVAWIQDHKRLASTSITLAANDQRKEEVMISNMGNRKEISIESISPRTVAKWWGIGAASNAKKPNDGLSRSEGEDWRTKILSGGSAKDRVTYHTKKGQSKAIVDGWIHNKGQDKDRDDYGSRGSSSGNKGSIMSSPSRFHVWCDSNIRNWYDQVEKRDDLSDSLLQAVAWFEWRERAIQETIDRFPLK